MRLRNGFLFVHFKYYVEISSPQADIDKPIPNLRCQRKVKAVRNVSGNMRNKEDTYGKRFGASVARYGKS